jgi:hypothetical protein
MLLPFAKTKLSAMSEKKRRSLDQELEGVAPSRRTMLLSSKTSLKTVIDNKPAHRVEPRLAELLGARCVLAEEIRALIKITCDESGAPFEAPRPLNRATKLQMLEWVSEQWGALGSVFTDICERQRPLVQNPMPRK